MDGEQNGTRPSERSERQSALGVQAQQVEGQQQAAQQQAQGEQQTQAAQGKHAKNAETADGLRAEIAALTAGRALGRRAG